MGKENSLASCSKGYVGSNKSKLHWRPRKTASFFFWYEGWEFVRDPTHVTQCSKKTTTPHLITIFPTL
jgi:hypothetical protein